MSPLFGKMWLIKGERLTGSVVHLHAPDQDGSQTNLVCMNGKWNNLADIIQISILAMRGISSATGLIKFSTMKSNTYAISNPDKMF